MRAYLGGFHPSEEEIKRAFRLGLRRTNYRWGTMWLTKSGWYVGLAWKVWIAGILLFFVLLYVVGFL
jgi:hypothetical protein